MPSGWKVRTEWAGEKREVGALECHFRQIITHTRARTRHTRGTYTHTRAQGTPAAHTLTRTTHTAHTHTHGTHTQHTTHTHAHTGENESHDDIHAARDKARRQFLEGLCDEPAPRGMDLSFYLGHLALNAAMLWLGWFYFSWLFL